MVTIKIEIGFDKEQKNTEFDIRKAAWLVALADSAIWLVFGVFSLTLLYGAIRSAYAISFIIGILGTYVIYLFGKARFLTGKYGRKVYRDEFGNTGFLLVAASVVLLFFQCFF
ncbi:MAG: hypothetical protein HDR25_00720 [Lachnospiraceae bacterium]|nr:hypothetical protein [Lachnospiraceae bacterium]